MDSLAALRYGAVASVTRLRENAEIQPLETRAERLADTASVLLAVDSPDLP